MSYGTCVRAINTALEELVHVTYVSVEGSTEVWKYFFGTVFILSTP